MSYRLASCWSFIEQCLKNRKETTPVPPQSPNSKNHHSPAFTANINKPSTDGETTLERFFVLWRQSSGSKWMNIHETPAGTTQSLALLQTDKRKLQGNFQIVCCSKISFGYFHESGGLSATTPHQRVSGMSTHQVTRYEIIRFLSGKNSKRYLQLA